MMGKERDSRRAQRVHISGSIGLSSNTNISLNTEPRFSRLTFVDTYATSLLNALEKRKLHKVIEGSGDSMTDLTPKLLDNTAIEFKLYNLGAKVNEVEGLRGSRAHRDLLLSTSSQRFFHRNSFEEALDAGISSQFGFAEESNPEEEEQYDDEPPPRVQPFIKIVLRKSKEIILYEAACLTVLRNTPEGREIEEDNKFYDFITVGKGRIRRTNTSEAQTNDVFFKTRETNTQPTKMETVDTFVSNFDMSETYKNIQSSTTSFSTDDSSKTDLTTYTVNGLEQATDFSSSHRFKLATMVTLRILSSNVYEEGQRRFRNMIASNPLSRDCLYQYTVRLLFRFNPLTQSRGRKSVADIAFCPGNGDIVAVAYGIFSFGAMHVPDNGYCCVWNIKNPNNPERSYFYNSPVVSVQFSPYMPQLLAIGLYDGSVEVRDISTFSEWPIAVSQRTETSSCDPITAIEWLPLPQSGRADNTEIEPFIALSQDGRVTKFRIINSPYLVAYPQIQLDRVEGTPEGLPVQRMWNETESYRSPQGLGITLHPRQHDIYFVLTNEGCLHKVSTNYPHQHLEVLQTHIGSVNVMDFSPWSPKLYLTAGNDWCIRIWISGVFEPLITLKNETGPIHSAAWSKTHSTVIVSNTRYAISVWDIRRSTLKPVSSTTIDKSHYTLFRFSRCGRSIALGNERGSVLMVGLDNMPFPPRFQYEELELALYRAISTKPELTTQLNEQFRRILN